ncbi:unnamed protein product [Prorocentrum cordatum]|uniref:Uncharacterized protein n=1 Tax=Prorocentrum cordatum TaxID=2364126 RepID=A0ABN9S9G6_9DINO|nr:unnamed protein product [Polarella glacialis]
MDDRHKPRKGTDATHAQWTAMWWTRALAQLTLQARAGRETMSVEALVSAFLDTNRVAVEGSGRTAAEYDASLWSEMAERTRRHDAACVPQAMVSNVEENRRARARSAAGLSASGARGSQQQQQQQQAQQAQHFAQVQQQYQGAPKGSGKRAGVNHQWSPPSAGQGARQWFQTPPPPPAKGGKGQRRRP